MKRKIEEESKRRRKFFFIFSYDGKIFHSQAMKHEELVTIFHNKNVEWGILIKELQMWQKIILEALMSRV